jgi:DNA (cytosine-5)-methyltransferase 1
MRYLSVCSGIEAASVAWESLGWTPVAFAEIEKFPSQVLAHHFPHVPNFGDMNKYKEWDQYIEKKSVDVIVGGTPCQSFSVAGLRRGLDDPRGNLALTFLSMVDHYRPTWIVWENVPGVLSSNDGRDFGAFIGALAELRYGFAWRVLDAQYFGVPQRRRRVFLVGHSSGDSRCAAKILFEQESLQWHPKKGRTSKKNSARSVTDGVDQYGIQRTVGTLCADTHPGAYSGQDAYTGRLVPVLFQSNQTDARIKIEPHTCQTVLARWGTGGGNTPLVGQPIALAENTIGCQPLNGGNGNGFTVGGPMYTLNATGVHGVAVPIGVRRLTPTECERLQGFPDGWTDIKQNGKDTPDGSRYKALGNSMAVPVMRWIGKRINEHC